jgi:hypothetical protein
MLPLVVRLVTLSVLGCLLAAPAAAQGSGEPPVSQLLPELVRNAARLAPSVSGDHTDHFVPAARSVAALGALNRALALQVAGFPAGPTEVGVVFVPGRGGEGTTSIGSSYTGQALTMGRGHRGFAVTYEGTTFEWIDDLNLRDSNVNLFLEHTCCSGDESERDLMQQVVSLALHRKVIGLVASFGLADRLDVGVMVPFVEVAADARVTSIILRTATDAMPGIHEFDPIDLGNRTIPGGQIPPAAGVTGTGSSTARGFGDIVVRSKLNVVRSGASGLAVAVDVRLPTGDADEFIGLGATQVRPALIWTVAAGRIVGRGRIEYAWSDGELSSQLADGVADLSVPNEFQFTLGVDAAVAPRTTFVADVIGRQVPDVPRFGTTTTIFPNRGPGPLPSEDFTALDRLQQDGSDTVNLFIASVGGRFRVTDAASANLRALFPFGNAGLRPAASVVLALDYGF